MGGGGGPAGAELHALPFQCKIRVLEPLLPTAHPLFAAANPSPRTVPVPGLATRVQALPFQRRTSVLSRVSPVVPPAHAAPPGANATVLSDVQDGALTVTFCQVFPFHFMLSGTRLVLESVPTAKAIPPGPAAMPDSSWNSPASGKLADTQAWPFQRTRKPSSWPTMEPVAHVAPVEVTATPFRRALPPSVVLTRDHFAPLSRKTSGK